MSRKLELNSSNITNWRCKRTLKSTHSILCQYINLTRLLSSILKRIFDTNNFILFAELIWDVLSHHFNMTEHSVHLIQYNIYDLPSFAKNLSTQFSTSLLQNSTLYDIKYCEKLTCKFTDIDSRLPPANVIHHGTFLLHIPICILSNIMSFLNILHTIKIERTCSTFFLAANENTSFSNMHYNFQSKIRKYGYISTNFFRRFTNITSLWLDSNTFKDVKDTAHFLQTFKQLMHLQISTENQSDLNTFLMVTATNSLNCIKHLTLIGCHINLEFFKCIKEFNMLDQLSLDCCYIEHGNLRNSPDLWNYYHFIQDCLSNVSKLEFICNEYDTDNNASLTLMRLMNTPNLQFLSIYILESDNDFRYHCPAERIAFVPLKLKELDLQLHVDNSPQYFLDDIIPFLTQLNSLIIREWAGKYALGVCVDNFKNNFLYRVITNSLHSLEQIKFRSGLLSAECLVYCMDYKIFEPLLSLYKICIVYPNWCKNVFKRFEFVVDLECDPGVPEEYEWLQELLYFLKDTASKLSYILKRNNISYLIKLNISCNCNCFRTGDMSVCICYQCKEIFGLLWHQQNNVMYLTDKLQVPVKKQRLITDYFNQT
eukprot:524533_1